MEHVTPQIEKCRLYKTKNQQNLFYIWFPRGNHEKQV